MPELQQTASGADLADDPLNSVAVEYVAGLIAGYAPLVMPDGEQLNVATFLRDIAAQRDQLELTCAELQQLADNRLQGERKVLPPRVLRRIANILDEEADGLRASFAMKHGDGHVWPSESVNFKRTHDEYRRQALRLRGVAG